MVDISKYGDVIRLIETYNGAIESNRKNYFEDMDRHPADFVGIGAESNRQEDEITSERLYALKKKFPNVEFSKDDVELLSDYYSKKQNNYDKISGVKASIESQKMYGGSSVSQEEIQKMKEAEKKQPDLENEYTNAYSNFFEVCEKLNSPEVLENPEFDFESEIFSKMYEQKFSLRPKNPILKKYYETYKSGRDKEKENQQLSEKNSALSEKIEHADQENIQLKNDNETLKSDNSDLKQKVGKLQGMLAKTLDFCDHVRKSTFGKFFFRKKIQELPAAGEDRDR